MISGLDRRVERLDRVDKIRQGSMKKETKFADEIRENHGIF